MLKSWTPPREKYSSAESVTQPQYYVPLHSNPTPGHHTNNIPTRAPKEHNVYDLKNTIAANVYALHTKTDLVKYIHLACWSPVVDTWCKAIDNGFFATFPVLTLDLVRKHLPPSM